MDEDDRYLGTLVVHVLNVSDLTKVTKFGVMDPYVVVGLNQDKQRTREITDGGEACMFDEKLRFNIDCMKQDLIHIKVKHKTTFSNTTIGIFSLKMQDFVKHQRKRLKFQLVDEEDFAPRGQIEIIPEYVGTNAPPMPAERVAAAPASSTSPAPNVASPVPVQRAAEPPASEQPKSPTTPSPRGDTSAASPTNQGASPPVPTLQPAPMPASSLALPPPSMVQQAPTPAAVQQPTIQPQQQPAMQVAAPVMQVAAPVYQSMPVAQPIARPIVQPGGGYIPPPVTIAAPVVTGGSYGTVQLPVIQQQQQQQQAYGSQQQQTYQSAPMAYQQPYGSQQPQQQQYQQQQMHCHHSHGGSSPPPYVPPTMGAPYQQASAPPMQQVQPQQQPQQQQQFIGAHTAVMSGLTSLGNMMTNLAVTAVPSLQASVQLAPFQTLAVGRPHQDSRMFDDMQYLTPQRIPHARIIEVRVFAGHTIAAIQLVYSVGGQRLDGPIAGATTYAPQVMYLQPDERIEQVLGRVSVYALESLTLKTNRQALRFGPENDGQEFQLNVPQGHRVLGFHGSFAPKGITSFGAYTVPTP